MGRNLLGVVGGHEVLMANGHREFGVGLEVSEPVGIGVQWLACLGIEIIFEYVSDLADGAVGVGIRVGWIEVDPDLIAR